MARGSGGTHSPAAMTTRCASGSWNTARAYRCSMTMKAVLRRSGGTWRVVASTLEQRVSDGTVECPVNVQTLRLEGLEILCITPSADGTALLCGMEDGSLILLASHHS